MNSDFNSYIFCVAMDLKIKKVIASSHFKIQIFFALQFWVYISQFWLLFFKAAIIILFIPWWKQAFILYSYSVSTIVLFKEVSVKHSL